MSDFPWILIGKLGWTIGMFSVELNMQILEGNRLVFSFNLKDVTLLSLNAKSLLQNHVYNLYGLYLYRDTVRQWEPEKCGIHRRLLL